MHSNLFFAMSLMATLSFALPTAPTLLEDRQSTEWTWDAGAVDQFPIHASCNATQQAQLRRALNETMTLATHAKDHILRYGTSSDIYVKYFGNASTAEPAGWFDRMVNSDKGGVLFRCDDIDNKCYQPGWGGHWRGEIAPDQTVICPLSFANKWNLESLCGHGYDVANGKDLNFFGPDLVHRLLHVYKISEGLVDHFADTQVDVLELAKLRPDQAVRNSVTLRRFAVEAYAHDVAVPGIGCPGVLVGGPSAVVDSHGAAATSSAGSTTSTPAAAASATTSSAAVRSSSTASPTSVAAPASTVASAAVECHTHSDGVVHCA